MFKLKIKLLFLFYNLLGIVLFIFKLYTFKEALSQYLSGCVAVIGMTLAEVFLVNFSRKNMLF